MRSIRAPAAIVAGVLALLPALAADVRDARAIEPGEELIEEEIGHSERTRALRDRPPQHDRIRLASDEMPETIRRPEGFDPEAERRRSTSPVLTALAHSAPMQMVFYDGTQFPEAYRGDADGALLVGDDETGVIYRVRYESERPPYQMPGTKR